jgi:hypothetical protein
MRPINRIGHVPRIDDLVPETTIEQLISEDRPLSAKRPLEVALSHREFFEFVSELYLQTPSDDQCVAVYYLPFYDTIKLLVAVGVSHEAIRANLAPPTDSDGELAAVIREAFDDALAGRPPRYELEQPDEDRAD